MHFIPTIILILLMFIAYSIYVNRTREIIYDNENKPYLIRYFLFRDKFIKHKLYLHHFLRSDFDRALHDHPWKFRSFILKGGYTEYTTWKDLEYPNKNVNGVWNLAPAFNQCMRKFGPLSYIVRPATWRHRLELDNGKDAWTLVLVSTKERDWGFWPSLDKWVYWEDYDYAS